MSENEDVGAADRGGGDPQQRVERSDLRHRFVVEDDPAGLDEHFKARLKVLGRTQTAFATELGVALRTVHYWASDGPPNEIAYLLDVLTMVELPFGPATAADQASFGRAVQAELDRLLSQVAAHRRSEFLDTASTWACARKATHS